MDLIDGDEVKITPEDAESGRDPNTTLIYFCATMWHENKKEMMLMLKSVLR